MIERICRTTLVMACLTILGCQQTHVRLYPGPARAKTEVATLWFDSTSPLLITSLDEHKAEALPSPCSSGGVCRIELMPGPHGLSVRYQECLTVRDPGEACDARGMSVDQRGTPIDERRDYVPLLCTVAKNELNGQLTACYGSTTSRSVKFTANAGEFYTFQSSRMGLEWKVEVVKAGDPDTPADAEIP